MKKVLPRSCSASATFEVPEDESRRRRISLVSSFPPRRCGIGRYAEQLAEHHARNGGVVRRVSLLGGEGSYVGRLDGSFRPLRLLRLTKRQDEVWVMWHPLFYVTGRCWQRTCAWLSLAVVAHLRRLTVVVHEQSDAIVRPAYRSLRFTASAESVAAQLFWAAPVKWLFHTDRERRAFLSKCRIGNRAGTALLPHGRTFRPAMVASQAAARQEIGIAVTGKMLLCIGFMGQHKGFDRAIRAFAATRVFSSNVSQLFIVGSPLCVTSEVMSHIELLKDLASDVPGVTVECRWLSDDEFDLWLQASDIVIAPYRQICSSSVVARAKLFGRRVIVSDVGGLPEQVGPEDFVVCSEEDLASAIASSVNAS